ncbi:MAG: FeoB-associated Cys-rich membrane protein [Parasporobacterium sp.]|nr:FeoB-associated Cys-rich membrane protein [Parasporobacterium sp.]
MDWIVQNAGTIIISLVLLAGVAAAIRKLWKDKKQKGSSCGCGCGSCSSCGMCHMQKK